MAVTHKRKSIESSRKGKLAPRPQVEISATPEDGFVDLEDEVSPSNNEGYDDAESIGSSFHSNEKEESEAGPSRKRAKPDLYRAPTFEEMDRIQATQESGGSEFALKLEALLSSALLPKDPPSPPLKAILSTIHSTIMSISSVPALPPAKALKKLKTSVPFPGPDEFSPLNEGVQWGLGFEKPEEIIVGGSWSVCGSYKRDKKRTGDIDIAVVMPKVLFSPKDRLSYRYFHKRAFYLAVIKAAMEKQSRAGDSPLSGVDVEWSYAYGDARRPIILLNIGKEQGLKRSTQIKVAASISSDTFPTSTLQPTKPQFRHPDIPQDSPTPLYATSILHDTLHKSSLLHLHNLSQTLPDRTVESFLALWRIWAGRRGIPRDKGASGWFASILLGWIVNGGSMGGVGGDRTRTKKQTGIGRSLTAWPALRAAWEFLAHTNFEKTPVFLHSQDDPAVPYTLFCESSKDVLVDPTGSVSVFASWEKGELQLLQHHARETLAMLEDTSVDRFENVFLDDRSIPSACFDESITVDFTGSTRTVDLLTRSEEPSHSSLLAKQIAETLRKGLTDRVRLVHCTPSASANSTGAVHIGLMYESSQATRVLDVGPSSEKEADCEAFRALWGDKAELRRFKDGSISESVVWDVSRPEEAAFVPARIVQWLLQRHFGLEVDIQNTASRGLLSIIQLPDSARDSVAALGSEKLGFRPIMDGYDQLQKTLKAIDTELPLSILQIQPASELLRYSSTFVPHPIDAARYASAPDCLKWVPRAEVVLQFESSPRWPDDLAAIQKVKLALMEKLARILITSQRGTTAQIAFDPHRTDIEDSAGLEVLLPSGVAFIIRIYHARERTLLERIIIEDTPSFGTSLPKPPRRLAIPALAHHVRRFVYLPQHHSFIAPLHHRYPSYSSATRLLKRWLSSHMLSLQVSSEAIELLMAKVYLDPGCLQTPASATAGFVRCMQILSEWSWSTDPVIIPSSNTFDSVRPTAAQGTRQAIMEAFEKRRKQNSGTHGATWILATEIDIEGLRWTSGISKVIASRVKALAKATLERTRTVEQWHASDIRRLFTPPLDDYDVVIHLHPSLLTRYAEGVNPDASEWTNRMRNVQDSIYGADVKPAFDPAENLAQDIQRLYGDSVLIFYDRHGGAVIGLLWNPDTQAARTMKPFLGYSTRPAESETPLITINKEGIMGEIARLGAGLTTDIKVRA